MIRLHVAQYYRCWKIEEEVTPQGHYITLPETYGNRAEALGAALRLGAEMGIKWNDELQVTIIEDNRNPHGSTNY